MDEGTHYCIENIRRCFESDSVLYTYHARFEMKNEEFGQIKEHEVYEAICTGEVIEEYPDDIPYPSLLIFGSTRNNRPLHAVCAYNIDQDLVIIITVYQPDPFLWQNYRRRKP